MGAGEQSRSESCCAFFLFILCLGLAEEAAPRRELRPAHSLLRSPSEPQAQPPEPTGHAHGPIVPVLPFFQAQWMSLVNKQSSWTGEVSLFVKREFGPRTPGSPLMF